MLKYVSSPFGLPPERKYMFLSSNRKFLRVESNSVCVHTDDREPGSDLFIVSIITD